MGERPCLVLIQNRLVGVVFVFEFSVSVLVLSSGFHSLVSNPE